MERGTRKSFLLAELSEQTGIPIIVSCKNQAIALNKLYPNANFFTVEELSNLDTSKGVYVDDLHQVVQELLNAKILLATHTCEKEL